MFRHYLSTEQSQGACLHDSLRPVRGAEFLEYVVQMELHRSLRNPENRANLPVRLTPGLPLLHLTLTVGKVSGILFRLSLLRATVTAGYFVDP
jgi:hypothetical protein